jgi:hypothetical protein
MTADIQPYRDKLQQNRRAKMVNTHSRTVFGIDWGRPQDPTVICVINAESKRAVETHKFQGYDWNTTRARIFALYHKHHPFLIIAEESSIGSVNIEALQSEGLPVRGVFMTKQNKTVFMDRLRSALINGELRLENEIAQQLMLLALEDNYQDDTLVAVALAWAATRRDYRVDFA